MSRQPASLSDGLRRALDGDRTTKLAGSVRTVPPAETLRRIAPVAAGVGVTRVADIGGLDRIGIPVSSAVRPSARSLATSQGKGVDVLAARLSALMEAVELWHAERHHLPVRFASHDELQAEGRELVDVQGLVTCPCNEFRPERPLRWTRALDLPTGTTVWVPYEAVHCDWRVPAMSGEHSFQNGTNGLASGNTVTEAVVHALCEVIERDATVRFGDLPAEQQQRRRVELDSIEDPTCVALLRQFAAAGIEVVVWDMTSELGVATFSCTAIEVSAPWHQPLPRARGSGTHLQREVALRRALTEAAQARAAIIAGSRDDIFYARYQDYFGLDGRREATAELDTPPVRRYSDAPTVVTDRPTHDLDLLVERLGDAGLGGISVVDLTHPRWQVPVMKVLVPGLLWRPWED